MLKSFFATWIIYWLVVLLLPVHSIYPGVYPAFMLQLCFVLLVAVGYCSVPLLCRSSGSPSVQQGRIPNANLLIRVSIFLSLIGFCSLLFDKVYIQHVSYLDGLAVAREQWRQLGEEREGKVSSIWSAIGYLVGSSYYAGLVLTITQSAFLTAGQRIRAMALVFFFVLTNSIITGGRSNFLLLAVVAIAALSSRRSIKLASVFQSPTQRRLFHFGAAISVCYIVYIFYARADAGNQLVSTYVSGFLPYLGLEFDGWYRSNLENDSIGASFNMLVLVLSYMTHSFATVAAIVDAPLEDKTILFHNAASLLYKLDLTNKPDDLWFLSGRFPSVPGALWHQYGVFGFFLGSLFLGGASGAAKVWAAIIPNRVLPLAAHVLTCATLLLTPYVFAPDVLSFPYVAFAFVMLAALSRALMHVVRRLQVTR